MQTPVFQIFAPQMPPPAKCRPRAAAPSPFPPPLIQCPDHYATEATQLAVR